MTDIQIWAFRTKGGPLVPFRIEPRAPDGELCNIIDLDTSKPEHHWVGRVRCSGCAYGFVGMLVLDSADALPPTRLPCPRCRHTAAVPLEHWAGSCEAHCAGCGKIWREIHPDRDAAPDAAPQYLRCTRCGIRTSDIRPWPLQNGR